MKILIINTLYFPHHIGGAEVSVQMLAEGLVSAGNQVRVITLHNEGYRKVSIINRVEVVYLPVRNFYWPFERVQRSRLARLFWHLRDNYNLQAARDVGKELDCFRPDIMHTNNISGFSVSVWSEAKKRNIKIIHTARDYYLFHPNATLYKGAENQSPDTGSVFVWSLMKKICARKVSTFIGISKYIRDFHVDAGFFLSAQNDYIYNPVEPINPDNFCYGNRFLRVGFIGRLSSVKGFDHFCNLISSFKNSCGEISAVAAGTFPVDEQHSLKVQAELSGIELLGMSTAADFLSKVDIVILPNQWREPFGRTVVEAALANKYVFTNPYGGVSELMELFPNVFPIDEKVIYDLIITGKANASPISAEIAAVFSVDEISKRYISEYERVTCGN
ncbi:TPA: glycosyltransferase family 4 protein [Serratia marcescens]|nr:MULTISPECIES: glycosyltransferase family 4 protein [Serratia]EGT0501608.1 glycosyltransferase family 4 protein [Serratia marcescens]EHT9831763.1 glycosyltransferase family 4 protein [Serratia marcescens]EMB7756309.1 glycosyltransferase family 4 protein [Serratia marcescens]MDP8748350.1 glycosyltransferase family 4 protein [Serratia marcescens]MDP8762744.1 glycosyltransferase family 4 protein [Serratia marcescens]